MGPRGNEKSKPSSAQPLWRHRSLQFITHCRRVRQGLQKFRTGQREQHCRRHQLDRRNAGYDFQQSNLATGVAFAGLADDSLAVSIQFELVTGAKPMRGEGQSLGDRLMRRRERFIEAADARINRCCQSRWLAIEVLVVRRCHLHDY